MPMQMNGEKEALGHDRERSKCSFLCQETDHADHLQKKLGLWLGAYAIAVTCREQAMAIKKTFQISVSPSLPPLSVMIEPMRLPVISKPYIGFHLTEALVSSDVYPWAENPVPGRSVIVPG